MPLKKKIKTAAGTPWTKVIVMDGVSQMTVQNCYDIRTQLGPLGFRWGQSGPWRMPMTQFIANQRAQQGLQSLGIPFTLPQQGNQPNQQQPQKGPQQQKPQGNWYQQTREKPWAAARMVADNSPVVIYQNPDGTWDWASDSGKQGKVSTEQAKTMFKTERGPDGKPIKDFDASKLFAMMNGKQPQDPTNPQGQASGVWTIALNKEFPLLAEGDPIAIKEDGSWMDEEGNRGKMDPQSLGTSTQPFNSPSGPLKGNEPKPLFEQFKKLSPPKKDFAPSPYQQAVIDDFKNTDKGIMIDALAGSGKTTLLRQIAQMKKPNEKWLYLVFNKRNQTEASTGDKRFPAGVTVLTSHSFLGSVLGQTAEKGGIEHTDLWSQGYGERIHSIIDEIMNEHDVIPYSFKWQAKKVVTELCQKAKNCAIDPNSQSFAADMQGLIQQYEIDTDLSTERQSAGRDYTPQLIQLAHEALTASLPGGVNSNELAGKRDHDDTLWYSALYANKVAWPHYDVVLADEVQDFNKCQTIMLNKLKEAGARIIAVGDPHQCQPAGTMISLTGGKTKAIEDVKIGDEVVTYNSKKSYFPGTNTQGRKILDIAKRNFNGNMITIKAGGYTHDCTPNHKCVIRFVDKKAWGVYLMIKGSLARVGMCRLKYLNGFGPTIRAVQEGADKLWLLSLHDSEINARVEESITAITFGLPQTIFSNKGQKFPNQEFIDSIYNRIENNINKAVECLNRFGRIFEYPLWCKEDMERYGSMKQNYICSKKSFTTQACNLISEYMAVRVFEGSCRGGEWHTCEVSVKETSCDVYSLKVESTEDQKRLYIANNIVTHNSLYAFRGADENAFHDAGKAADQTSPETYKQLPTNYRSGTAIIDFVNQNTNVHNLQAGKKHKGVVTEGTKKEDFMGDLKKEWIANGRKLNAPTTVISYANQPLVDMAMNCIKDDIDFEIMGKDLSKDMIKTIQRVTGKGLKTKQLSLDDFAIQLDQKLNELQNLWKDKISKRKELEEIEKNVECLSTVVGHLHENGYEDKRLGMKVNNTNDLMAYLQKKFGGINEANADEVKKFKARDPRSYILFSTSHKSKGFEFNRVALAEPDTFQPKEKDTRLSRKQKQNAYYVALTRAEKELHILANTPPPTEDDDGGPVGPRMRMRNRQR